MRIVTIIVWSLFAFIVQAADLSAQLLTDEWSIRSDLMDGTAIEPQKLEHKSIQR